MDRIEKIPGTDEWADLLNQAEQIFGGQTDDEVDLPPEYCSYKDEGCALSPSCLQCPLPRCVEELSWGRQKLSKALRDKEIRHLYAQEKHTPGQLANQFKISLRTVQRVLAQE